MNVNWIKRIVNTDIEHMIEIALTAQGFCEGNPFPKYRSISKTEQKYDKATSSLQPKRSREKIENYHQELRVLEVWGVFQLLLVY